MGIIHFDQSGLALHINSDKLDHLPEDIQQELSIFFANNMLNQREKNRLVKTINKIHQAGQA